MFRFFLKNKLPGIMGVIFLLFVFFSFNTSLAVATGYDVNSGSSDATAWGGAAGNIQNRTALGNDDPRNIVANIVNISLGFLGILAILIIMYAGFLWMMSGGNIDKINKAKRILIGGFIGLVIVLSSFAIASFVLDAIFRATTDGSASGGTGGLAGPIGGGGSGGGSGGSGNLTLPCSSTSGSCTASDALCAPLGALWTCNPTSCLCEVTNMGSCYNPFADVCNYPCSAGLSCLGASGCEDNLPVGGCGLGDTSCYCCCDPANDQCSSIYPTLYCSPDIAPCDSASNSRGMCCGCTADAECGGAPNACGDDTCCHPRPRVVDVPLDGEMDVCTNALISIQFDQPIKSASLINNILIIGEYNGVACPSNTNLIDPRDPSIPLPFSSGTNYCAVSGSARTRNESGNYYVDFIANNFLDIATNYYIIVRGDQNINNDINEGIQNYWGISMDGSNLSVFTTIDDSSGAGGICAIDKVSLAPVSYLFRTSQDSVREDDTDADSPTFDTAVDRDKLFVAQALSPSNQILAPIFGYQWDWNFLNSAGSVVSLDLSVPNLKNGTAMIEAVAGVTDGRSIITATIDMSAYASTNTSNDGDGKFDSSNIYVFICNNPWPPVNESAIPPALMWAPWEPATNSYHYDIYYCRDVAGGGTANDLPAFDSTGVSSPPTPDILQQVYFSYQTPPPPGVIINITSAAPNILFQDGGAVTIDWSGAPIGYTGAPIAGYKIYWGENSGDYLNSIDVGLPSTLTYDISGLVNERTYYFSVTAYTDDRAESSFYQEVSVVPHDEFAPTIAPTFVSSDIVVRATEVELFWDEVDDADSYEISYGLQAGPPYGVEINVDKDTGVIITNLSSNTQYYFGLRALDAAGNASPYSVFASSTLAL